MFNKITIKTKLLLLALVGSVSMIGLIFFFQSSSSKIKELEEGLVLIAKLEADMLMLRRNEKDFLSRKQIKYFDTFEKNTNILFEDLKKLNTIYNKNNLKNKEIMQLQKIITQYKEQFTKLVTVQKQIGLTHIDGLYGSLRNSVHNVQSIAKKQKDFHLLSLVYELRKHEKDFMLRRDLKYVQKYEKLIATMEVEYSQEINTYLKNYKKDFLSLVAAETLIGLDSKRGLLGELRTVIHTSEKSLKTLSINGKKIIEEYVRDITIIAWIVGIVLVFILLFVSFLINQNITNKISKFQVGLLAFFKYLNRESQTVAPLDTSSHDEISVMAKVVNENIEKTKIAIDNDRAVIEDTIQVLSEFEQGDLCQRVTLQSENPALNELTTLLNKMGDNIESNIDSVLTVLEEYSNSNYINRVESKDLKKHLLELVNGVNNLGDAISKMLQENLQMGELLQGRGQVLLNDVNILNKNTQEAAASIEETAASLEQMTENLTTNTHSISQMANYTSNLTQSASKGKKLALNTTTAMEEIDAQVSSINEAITVIDQIAFQTNILSLNAAVEAATAGEAGKGFAVVAGEVRNLASRSAEAANEIKTLVEHATQKADYGKQIAQEMTYGYEKLNDDITHTMDLIKTIENTSKEQLQGIEQINKAMGVLDNQTQENSMIATKTNDTAIETNKIANFILEDVQKKQF